MRVVAVLAAVLAVAGLAVAPVAAPGPVTAAPRAGAGPDLRVMGNS